MPVRFKGMSEYNKHFNWHDSFRSKSFQPTEDQASDPAGQSSVLASMTYEPPLQHKKRLGGPPTSLSANFYEKATRNAEYTLLGQQDKFSDNVRYTVKKSQPGVYKNKENLDDEAPPNKQLRMQKRIKPLLKERHPPIPMSKPSTYQHVDSATSPPPAPRVDTSIDLDEVKVALKDKDLKDILGDSLGKEKAARALVAKKEESKKEQKVSGVSRADKVKVKGSGKAGEISVMNEGIQTNMKKGVMQSAPEAPADYAMKYKAGVAQPRPVKKFSEYQKQFQWKHGQKASPLLAAEQIVYSSNTELGPYKCDASAKVSEYKREFQPWTPLDTGGESLNLTHNKSLHKEDKKKAVVKRSKSAAADVRRERKDESFNKTENDKSAELKEKLKSTHGKIRRLGSEYQANFKSPTSYYNRHGAWKGADPPQMMPPSQKKAVDDTAVANGGDVAPLSNWFAEVLELRHRAAEYRKRAQGTHFSREHLVQLMARQTDCWDVNSQVSSTLSALNLEAPALGHRMSQECPDSPVMSDDVELEDLEDEQEEEVLEPHGVKESKKTSASASGRKMSRLRGDKQAVAKQQRKMKERAEKEAAVEMGEDDDDDDVVEDDEGRQPTPKLKLDKTSVSRHHLDRTTPAVGGALLSCPPSRNSKMIVTSRSGDSYVTASDNMEMSDTQKKYDMDRLKTRPILGQPSGDTHALRDDDASSDRVLNTRYVPTPVQVPVSGDEDKENADVHVHQTKTSKTSKRLTPVQEGVGKTFTKHKRFLTLDEVRASQRQAPTGGDDDDAMSVSMMSVASSASLASQVLERARKRKEFWDKGDAGSR